MKTLLTAIDQQVIVLGQKVFDYPKWSLSIAFSLVFIVAIVSRIVNDDTEIQPAVFQQEESTLMMALPEPRVIATAEIIKQSLRQAAREQQLQPQVTIVTPRDDKQQTKDTQSNVRVAQIVVHKSLYAAALRAGMSKKQLQSLKHIFHNQVNFRRDIRPGDQVTAVYKNHGAILAAELRLHGRTYTAVRFTNKQGKTSYYDSRGRSLESSFMRYPVRFTRVSAKFNLYRRHPILRFVRPHYGIDLVAPRGTPVKAAADGRIAFRGRKSGFGKLITIRHNHHIKTFYAHLSRYARRLHNGSRVHKGQVIGYVGSTGLATGPHLHYEIHVRGKARNPQTISLPRPILLAKNTRQKFKRQSNILLAKLHQQQFA